MLPRPLLDLRGIGLVTGEPGGGKTTICRKVVASLHSGLYRVFYVPQRLDAFECFGLPPTCTGTSPRSTSPISRQRSLTSRSASRTMRDQTPKPALSVGNLDVKRQG